MSAPLIDWGVSSRALPGQAASGDRHVIEAFPGGALIGAIDGLGHGDAAASASRTAGDVLGRHCSESVIALARRCHEALLSTRGVVMSLASFNGGDQTMTWLGVGNVEGVLLRANARAVPMREQLLLRGGVVGYQLPQLSAWVLPLCRGDTLIFATDGIRSEFASVVDSGGSAAALADRILAGYAKGTDDALVVVARYAGIER
ncbi:MAG TPA: SpoIIE family protein phosphatase [Vicinamibacteria bacterium]|nr:SpoIIE family protein phosphatase [Vicinamibacteria bacterium]